MLEGVGGLIAAIKEAGPKVYGAVLIAGLVVLFLPESYANQAGLAEARNLYRPYIGGAVIVSASLLCVHALSSVASMLFRIRDDRRIKRNIIQCLRELTWDEKAFLRGFIDGQENTLYASYSDGVVGGLLAKHLIYRASNMSSPGLQFPYNLQPPVRNILNERPELLS